MKKTATLILALALGITAMGQHKNEHSRHHKEPPKIEEMVNDLSAIQKKRLNTVMENSRKEVDRLQAELDKVRKQIHALSQKDGDNSDQLFPLYDREAALRADIAKEMYRTRLLIDEILTKEQLAEMRARLEKDCKKGKSRDASVAPVKPDDRTTAPSDKPRRAPRK
jgi:Spy/CpxP family protein refolding chaperone